MSAQERWAADALWAGEAIVARLRAAVPDLREVLSIDQYDPAVTVPRQLPSAIVMLDAMRPTSTPLRRITDVEQVWMVALAARSAARDPDARASIFGVLIPPVITALQGWQPFADSRPLAWTAGYKPSYGKDVSYFPLLFTLLTVSA